MWYPRAVGYDTVASQRTPACSSCTAGCTEGNLITLNLSRLSQPTLEAGELLHAMFKDTVPAEVSPKTQVPSSALEGGLLFLRPQPALQFYLQD